MEKYNELEQIVLNIKEDLKKFHEKGNKTAGLRARKAMQLIKGLSQDIRVDISTKRRAMPVKKKKK